MNKFKQPLDLREVVNLLQADLVWSKDFDVIRSPLANLLIAIQVMPDEGRQFIAQDLESFLDAVLDQPIITVGGK